MYKNFDSQNFAFVLDVRAENIYKYHPHVEEVLGPKTDLLTDPICPQKYLQVS